METRREEAFNAHEPTLSADEIQGAIDAERAALSLKGLPVLHEGGIIQFLAVKFALADGTQETLLLDRFAAAMLRKLIEANDQLGWDGNSLRAGPARH